MNHENRVERGVAKEWLHEFLDGVFPPRCLVCGRSAPGNGWACPLHALPEERADLRCLSCARRLPQFALEGERCPACRESSPALKRLLVLADYGHGEPIRDWILALKHGGRSELAEPLGRALGLLHRGSVLDLDSEGDAYVPVPLHPLRHMERGYDQARGLARGAKEVTGVPVVRALRRSRYTLPQGEAGSTGRFANLSGAIAAYRGNGLRGKRVWLIDDVVTSGATLAACAKVARRLGAREVCGVALALAVPQGSESRVRGPGLGPFY